MLSALGIKVFVLQSLLIFLSEACDISVEGMHYEICSKRHPDRSSVQCHMYVYPQRTICFIFSEIPHHRLWLLFDSFSYLNSCLHLLNIWSQERVEILPQESSYLFNLEPVLRHFLFFLCSLLNDTSWFSWTLYVLISQQFYYELSQVTCLNPKQASYSFLGRLTLS